MDKTTIITY